ncbi:MAG: TOMM precursor leader peptide-binding protein, partial [Candidatus Vecturithrix sp.]|nr:TOMM precursor leader peptide-binding protein [Candidatus Vecturithrix sp.]
MLAKPRFKPHFHVEAAPDEDVIYLLSEKGHHCLRGSLYRVLAPLLNGNHNVAEIVEILKLFTSEANIRNALLRLEEQGYLVEAEEALPEASAAFWGLHGIDAKLAKSRISGSKVSLRAFGQVPQQSFVTHLKELGVQTDHESDFVVALTDDYVQSGLRELNQECLQTKKFWLLVKPVGAVLWIGPLFVPGDTGCWQCLAHRLREHRKVESSLQYQLEISAPFPTSRAMLPSTLQAGFSLAATQVALALVQPDLSPLQGVIVTIDAATLQMDRHILTKRPQCPVCGIPSVDKPQPLQLQSRKKFFTEDGGHRICSPTETFKRYGHLVSSITGVVGELKSVFSDANGLISIYSGTHRVLLTNKNFQQLQASLRNNSTGKGRSALQSRASAFSEAIERYCAVYQGHEFRIRRPSRQMEEDFIPLEACMLFSEAQYDRREEWNHSHLAIEFVPVRLDPDKTIDWTPAWSLTSQRFKYVPTAYCYSQYRDPSDAEDPFYNVDSNGLAAGNVLEEAIVQGFFEVIERDAVSIWWYNRLRRPCVDLDRFHDAYFDALREYYASLGREFWVLD